MKEYLSSIRDVLENQKTTSEGLPSKEAESRLQKYGKNRLAEGKKESIVNLLLEVFNNRFHVPLSVKVGYLPPKKKSALEFNDLLLQA